MAEAGRAGSHSEAEISDRLAIMQASRRLWDECSTMLYGHHVFCFHVGSIPFNDTLLTQRIANLMQDIEVNLNPSKNSDSIRTLQLFGEPQIPRSSCLVKLKFRKIDLIDINVIEALKRLTSFELLGFEMDAPAILRRQAPNTLIPWVSGLLAHIQNEMEPALGPSNYENSDCYRRLIFKPQSHTEFHRKAQEFKTKVERKPKSASLIRPE